MLLSVFLSLLHSDDDDVLIANNDDDNSSPVAADFSVTSPNAVEIGCALPGEQSHVAIQVVYCIHS